MRKKIFYSMLDILQEITIYVIKVTVFTYLRNIAVNPLGIW